MNPRGLIVGIIAVFALIATAMIAEAQGPKPTPPKPKVPAVGPGTAFTYQGQLKKNGVLRNGFSCFFHFDLYDSLISGNHIAGPVWGNPNPAPVINGLFTLQVDFGVNVFTGTLLYLQPTVQCADDVSIYPLSRQQLTPAPYAIFSMAPWVPQGNNIYYNNGNVGIGTTNPTSKLEIGSQDGFAITGYQPFLTLRDTNWSDARSVIKGAYGGFYFYPHSFIGGNAPVMIENGTGSVGIGTTAPGALLSVVHSGAPEPSASGAATALKVGAPSGTLPLALRQNVVESGNPTLAWFETASGAVGQLGATTGTFLVGALSGKGLALNVNGSTTAMQIASNGYVGMNGNVGIGISGQNNVRLTVQSPGTTSGTYGMRVFNGNANPTLMVRDDGHVEITSPGTTGSTYGLWVGNGNGSTTLKVRDDGQVYIGYMGYNGDFVTTHLCSDAGGSGGGLLTLCSSAAEYVPTIDSGFGFPETADVVSIVPNIPNPYGDDHGPFVVAKSTRACDDNLLGFLLKPESGADGKKLNDHYLPLAIYGYFPAKVTPANGAIHRGDPLTSSSKVGYAMKATGACKIIGYALEDANADGTIKVFAHLSENTAPQVAALEKENAVLKTQNAQLETRVNTLEQTSASLQTRLSALEQLAQANNAPVPSDSTPQVAWLVIGGLLGIIVAQKLRQDGER